MADINGDTHLVKLSDKSLPSMGPFPRLSLRRFSLIISCRINLANCNLKISTIGELLWIVKLDGLHHAATYYLPMLFSFIGDKPDSLLPKTILSYCSK